MSSIRGRYFLAAILSVIFSLETSMKVIMEVIFDFGLNPSFMESLDVTGVLSTTSPGIVAKVLADDIPRGIGRFALVDITVDDILDRTQQHPGPALSVGDLAEHWMSSRQHDYVVVDNDDAVCIISVRCSDTCPGIPGPKSRLKT